MKFTGCSCVGCNNIFVETDDVVVCPVCGSPHHRACYNEQGKCANSALHGEEFTWVFPEELKKKEEPKKAEEPIDTNIRFKNGENAVVCPHCKALNYGNDAFCMKCHKPFIDEVKTDEESYYENVNPENEAPVNENAGESNAAENPYFNNFNNQPPLNDEYAYNFYQRFGGLRPEILVEGIPASEYADYIGEKKSGTYIRKFANMERFGRKISVSICALLFGPLWFLYRKMYKEGLLYGLAIIVLAVLTGICSLTDQSKLIYDEMAGMYGELMSGELTMTQFQEETAAIAEKYADVPLSKADEAKITLSYVASAASFALSMLMVFSADRLYLKKIKKDIYAAREKCTSMPEYRRALIEKGGVSPGGAVLGAGILLLSYILQLIPSYIYLFSQMMN